MAGNELFRVETNILPRAKLVIVFCGLAFALLISYIDQNSIGIALPIIGQDLSCANTIAWAGTSSLIANTVFQVLYGRLSDIFGRKVTFLSSVGLLALGDLLCGFARTGPQLYAFRAIAGVGTGGIGALTMMIVSDIVTLENRGKSISRYLGSCIGGGNIIGPFLTAAFIEKSTWRGLFWLLCPLAVTSGIMVLLILPESKVTGDPKDKLKAIDFIGITFSTAAILLLLISISGGGTYFPCSSTMVIVMLTIGSISTVLFILTEWKIALMPMPLRLYKTPAICVIFIQNFLFGIVYYSHLYYLPIYYQNTRQFSPISSAALTVPFVAGQAIFSILSGQYVSRTKRYGEVIWTGFALWTLGDGLVLLFSRTLNTWKIALILVVAGAGVRNVFQPTLAAAQAHSRKHDRAVVISVRNFLRSLGGAIGLALSSAIFSNVLSNTLNTSGDSIPMATKDAILASILRVTDLSQLSSIQKDDVLNAYMASSRAVFTMWAPLMGVCLLSCLLVKDRGLTRPGEEKKVEHQQNTTVSERSADVESERELELQQSQGGGLDNESSIGDK